MDRQLLERMIGAGVLIVALIFIAPIILDGAREVDPTETGGQSEPAEDLLTHTIVLDEQPASPPVARQTNATPVDDSAKDQSANNRAGQNANAEKPAPSTVPSEKVPATKPVTVAVVKPEPKKPVPAVTPKATAPKPATPSPPKTASTAGPAATGWVVQLGSFGQKDNAQRLAKEVENRGFTAFMIPVERSGKTLYRVRVGPENSRAKAEDLAKSLAQAGYKGQVTSQ